jgi:hypothetical protein
MKQYTDFVPSSLKFEKPNTSKVSEACFSNRIETCHVSFTLQDRDVVLTSQELDEFLSSVRTTVDQYVFDHCQEWFGVQLTLDTIAKYGKVVFRVEDHCRVYDKDKQVISLGDIDANDKGKFIMKLDHLKFDQQAYAIVWSISSMKLYSSKFPFSDDTPAAPPPSPVPVAVPVSEPVPDTFFS